jgi:hypothetical protein
MLEGRVSFLISVKITIHPIIIEEPHFDALQPHRSVPKCYLHLNFQPANK